MRLIGKMFALLLAGVLTLVVWAFNILGWILSFVGVFALLLFGISLIVIVFRGLWHTLPILIALFAACCLVFFGSAFISGEILHLRNRLLGR